MKRRKPHHDQPLLPLRDTVGAMPAAEDEPDEPGNPDDELSNWDWVVKYQDGCMTLDDDEPYTAEEIEIQKRHPTDYDRTPNPERT